MENGMRCEYPVLCQASLEMRKVCTQGPYSGGVQQRAPRYSAWCWRWYCMYGLRMYSEYEQDQIAQGCELQARTCEAVRPVGRPTTKGSSDGNCATEPCELRRTGVEQHNTAQARLSHEPWPHKSSSYCACRTVRASRLLQKTLLRSCSSLSTQCMAAWLGKYLVALGEHTPSVEDKRDTVSLGMK